LIRKSLGAFDLLIASSLADLIFKSLASFDPEIAGRALISN